MWLFAIFITEFSPNPASPQTEWVELYNDSLDNTDISGYLIRDSTSSNQQVLTGNIPSQSYFTFSFENNFLNNTTADIIKLFDKNNILIDSQSSKPLPSGLSFSKQVDGTWCPTDISPNLPNNICKESYSLQNTPTPIPYISLKIINLDPDAETIEIENPNNFSVQLYDWRVIDNSGSTRKLSCTTVDANSSCTSTFSSGYLNNTSDKLTLLDPLKREISIYTYNLKKQTTPKPTSTIVQKKSLSPLLASPKLLSEGRSEGFASKSATALTVNKTSSIPHYLSIIFMLIGSIFIISPLLFHAKFNQK